ncbi:MAG: phosphocholine cytidylyltransferase family protein [Rhodospirillaceae bacterium]|jgi:choline kinase|nr:phosphocholine cytidylyltransferase family protein [Rhodospirillaceae bacterium]
MKALMLAAGLGRRLFGDDNHEPPKALLRFEGQTLLERHIELLQAHNIEELVLIVGHEKDMLLDEAHSVSHPGFVRSIENPRYREGPILSLACGAEVLRSGSDVMFMDADVLYHPLLLEKLIVSPHRNSFLLDREFQSDDDPVKLCLNDGVVVDFGKQVDAPHDIVGEWPGFMKMEPRIATRLMDVADAIIERGEIEGAYERAMREVLLSEPPGTFCHDDVTGIPWVEIDFPSDLEKATSKVFPRIGDYLAEITIKEVGTS